MPINNYSKAKLKAYVDCYVTRSKSLQMYAFNYMRIADIVFNKLQTAKNELSRCLSTKEKRPLNVNDIKKIIVACNNLLLIQYEKINPSMARKEVDQFEAEVCRKLNLTKTPPVVADDFRLDNRFEDAKGLENFGVPDLVEWKSGSFDFLTELAKMQENSHEMLIEIEREIYRVTDPSQKLTVLNAAVSVSMLNHPGSSFHESSYNAALRIAGHAELQFFMHGYGVADDLRKLATRLSLQLNWSRMIPTLNSPCNYIRYALNNKKMSQSIWKSVQASFDEAIRAANELVSIDPSDPMGYKARSSVISMKARLAAMLGNAGINREADALIKLAMKDDEKLPNPYGFAYPILKLIIERKYRMALTQCEKTIAIMEQSQNKIAASAFAALFLQINAVNGSGLTTDPYILGLANQAVKSPSTCYEYSHVFEADKTSKLLHQQRKYLPKNK